MHDDSDTNSGLSVENIWALRGEKNKTIINEVFSSSAPYLWKRFGMVSAPPEARRGTMGWRMFWGRGGGGYDLSRDLGQGGGGGGA